MPDIRDIVNVQIYLETGGIDKAGFGTMMCLDPHLVNYNRIKEYASLDEMNDDGFAPDDSAYLAALAYFSADPKPKKIKIGRRGINKLYLWFKGTLDIGNTFQLYINEESVEHTNETGSELTSADLAAAMATAINNTLDDVSAVADSEVVYVQRTDEDPDGLWITGDEGFSVHLLVYKLEIDDDPGPAASTTYGITMDGQNYTFTTDEETSVGEFIGNMVDAIDEQGPYYACSNNAVDSVFIGKRGLSDPGIQFEGSNCPIEELTLAHVTSVEDATDHEQMMTYYSSILEDISIALYNVQDSDDSWYGLMETTRIPADQLSMAGWAFGSSTPKLCGVASDDEDISDKKANDDMTSIAFQLKNTGNFRTFGIYHPDADGSESDPYPDAAYFGARLTIDLDVETATWCYANCPGLPAVDITSNELSNIVGDMSNGSDGKDFNVYVSMAGRNVMLNGKTCGGEWIDVIIGRDWLQARMTENIALALLNRKVIPYTNAGIAIVSSAMNATLLRAQGTGFLANDLTLGPLGYYTEIPDVNDVEDADKAARVLKGVKFIATVSGAIHVVQIIGTLTI